jgi:UDP-N-acetylglucosamine 2-epimerase (non-hydrolysing)/GDP/UDP-N,N'-diacetylbacillosamine 2-epimerase (hydrolysing)
VTLQYERTAFHVQELLAALEACDEHVVFTYPNADTHGRVIIDAIRDFVACNPRAQCAVNLGTQGYCSLLRHAKAMIGNSSSGIIEAATYELPVVNIGDRQRGRVHGRNVIVSKEDRESILQSIRKAVDPQFRDGLNGMKNPYGDGHAAEAIVARLKSVELNEALLLKRFRDLPIEAQNNSISLAGTK